MRDDDVAGNMWLPIPVAGGDGLQAARAGQRDAVRRHRRRHVVGQLVCERVVSAL